MKVKIDARLTCDRKLKVENWHRKALYCTRRARRNDVQAKNAISAATPSAVAMSQCVTSRAYARNAAFAQPTASTANTAPVIS